MIEQIAVLGAGTMGHGIAETFAMAGFAVNLFDVSADMLGKIKGIMAEEMGFLAENGLISQADVGAALNRITLFERMEDAARDADYVIEATPEKMELKQDLFAALDRCCKPSAILASNTSSLPLEGMMAKVSPARKKKMLVCHWYNPAHLMPIAELSFFGNMDEEDYRTVEALYQKAGKQTVRVRKDVPGLVANRIQQGVAREVFSIMEQGIADPEDVEKALKFGPAFRYATTGQLVVADMGGLDIWCTVGDNLLPAMDNRQEASPLLRSKVREGKLGMKSGEGFFSYPPEQVSQIQKKFNKKLIIQLKASQNYIED